MWRNLRILNSPWRGLRSEMSSRVKKGCINELSVHSRCLFQCGLSKTDEADGSAPTSTRPLHFSPGCALSRTATALPLASRPLLLFRRLEVADLNRLAKSTSLHPFRTSNALQAAAEMPPRLHDGLAPANTRYFLTTGILLALLILSFLWSTGPSTSSSILIQRLQASEDLYQRTKRKRDAWLDTMGGPVHSTPLVYRWKGA